MVVWKDKKNVAFLNNIYGQSERQVNRKQRNGSVTSPTCAAGYNMNMGGVDLADQKRKANTCSRKSEKWSSGFCLRLRSSMHTFCLLLLHVLKNDTEGV